MQKVAVVDWEEETLVYMLESAGLDREEEETEEPQAPENVAKEINDDLDDYFPRYVG